MLINLQISAIVLLAGSVAAIDLNINDEGKLLLRGIETVLLLPDLLNRICEKCGSDRGLQHDVELHIQHHRPRSG